MLSHVAQTPPQLGPLLALLNKLREVFWRLEECLRGTVRGLSSGLKLGAFSLHLSSLLILLEISTASSTPGAFYLTLLSFL